MTRVCEHGTVPARLSGEREAFEQSVKLQSHYAELLNQYDGGERLTFASADAWIARLAAAGSGSLFDDYQTLNNVLDDPAAIWRVVSASGKNVYFTDTDPRPGNMESGGTATKYERAAGSDGKAEPVVTIGECAQLVWSGEDLWDALAWNPMLSRELDALFLIATCTKEPVGIGLQFIALAKAAQRLAVEKRLAA